MSNTLAAIGISVYSLIRCFKCFKQRSMTIWISTDVEEIVYGGIVHDNLLFAYRLFVFLFTLIVTIFHLFIKGFKPLRFYTKWNFYSLMCYFGLTVWETIWYRRRQARDKEHPFGPGSYLAIVLYHLNMTTVWTVCIGTWGFFYPLYRGHPEACKTFLFNTFSYIEHIANIFLMLGELMMNRMPFYDHLRGTVGCWVVTYIWWNFIYHIHTGNWIYPFTNTSYYWSPFVYLFGSYAHLLAFKLFRLMHNTKCRIFLNSENSNDTHRNKIIKFKDD